MSNSSVISTEHKVTCDQTCFFLNIREGGYDRRLNIRAKPRHERSRVVLIAQLEEHCTGNAKVVGLNPIQSLNFFRSFFQ